MKKANLLLCLLASFGCLVFSQAVLAQSFSEAFDDNIYAYHTPIYPRSGRTVTFMAVANHPAGIKKIRFWVNLYQLGIDSSGNIVYDPLIGAWDSDTTGHSCTFSSPYPTSATCSFPFNVSGRWVPVDSYAVYSVSMRDGNDNLHRDRKIRADMKVVDPDIRNARNRALRIYRRGIKAEKFNVVFVSDNSFANQNAYIAMLEQQVPNGLLKVAPPVHLDRYRRFFNLYMNDYSRRLDDSYSNPAGSGCSDSNLASLEGSIPNADDLTWADDFIIAHSPSTQDCSRAGISSADDSNVVVHETMHSLFRLRDEYPDGGSSAGIGPHSNRYTSAAACTSHATASHAPEYAASPGCRSLGALSDGTANPAQHWCPGGDIMVNNSASMSTEEHAQVLDYIGAGSLSAFSRPPDASMRRVPDQTEQAILVAEMNEAIAADQAEEREEKQKKTLILKLDFDGNQVRLLQKKIVVGPAPHLFFPNIEKDFLVSIFDRSGGLVQSFWIEDPRILDNEKPLVQGEMPGPPLGASEMKLRISFHSKMAKVRIQNRQQQLLLDAPL